MNDQSSSSSSSSSENIAHPFPFNNTQVYNHIHNRNEQDYYDYTRNLIEEQDQLLPQPHTSPTFIGNVNPNNSSSNASQPKQDCCTCFCVIVLLTFCFFASMTSIMGFFGPSDFKLGRNSSTLLQVNSFFVNTIKVQELSGPKSGLMLYGFDRPPPLSVETNWLETHKATLPSNYHKEWIYFLNEGSEMNISYTVKHSYPLSLVIAQGRESFVEWIEHPAYPNLTLSWNIIYGSGMIQQKITQSDYYYVAVGNLNSEEVKAKLNFSIGATLYNTSEASYECSVVNRICSFNVVLLGTSAAVLTSTGPDSSNSSNDWYINLSYEPRWISYFAGSGALTVLILIIMKVCMKCQSTNEPRVEIQPREVPPEITPLLPQKDEDSSSLGSSYDSVSHDEDVEESCATGSLDTNQQKEHVCVVCFDAPRDCFFLPCGHSATCFSCGTRIVDEAGTCPICRRKMKKVRKIYTV
ncbi:hypothetical protein ACHQM5_020792 [Ranunculus cassubicifolius]